MGLTFNEEILMIQVVPNDQDITKLKDGKYMQNYAKRRRVFSVNNSPSMTDSSWKDDCCVNTIMNKLIKGQDLTHLNKNSGQFADISGIQDLHSSMTLVKDAEYQFKMLPAEVRAFFKNDMRNAEKFLRDPANREKAQKLGLLKKDLPLPKGEVAEATTTKGGSTEIPPTTTETTQTPTGTPKT